LSYRAGRCVTWDEATAGHLADELSVAMRSKRRPRPVGPTARCAPCSPTSS